MLTDSGLKTLKPKDKPYKVTDRDGMYVRVATTGTISFRLDYRLNGRRETIAFGKYGRDGIRSLMRGSCVSMRRERFGRGDLPRWKSRGRNAGSKRRKALASSARSG
jgi:hypothetical protein